MNTWTPQHINEGSVPTLRQPLKLLTWEGVPGISACRSQAVYLSKPDGSKLFTTEGETISIKSAAKIGARFGQQRIILTPLVTSGLNLVPYAVRLADLWGLNEYGWYAAAHYDTEHPHIHFVAETDSGNGERLSLSDETMSAWMLHAQSLSTNILGLYKHA